MQSNNPGSYKGKLATLALSPLRGSSTESASSPPVPDGQTKNQLKPRVRFSLPPDPKRQTQSQIQSLTRTQINSQLRSSLRPLHLPQNKTHARTKSLHTPALAKNILQTLQLESDKTKWCNKTMKPTLWTEMEMEKVRENQGDELFVHVERWLESIYQIKFSPWGRGGVFEKENMSMCELKVVVEGMSGVWSAGGNKDGAVYGDGANGKIRETIAKVSGSSKVVDKTVRYHRESCLR